MKYFLYATLYYYYKVLKRNMLRYLIIDNYLFKEMSVHKSADNDDLKTGFETKFGIEKCVE